MQRIAGGVVQSSFSYGSRGAAGWGVLQIVGEIPTSVVESGVGYTTRLAASGGFQPDARNRSRRLVWMGAAREPWRFLIHTTESGADASNRPDNNFSHGLAVRRQAQVVGAARPSQYWASPDWASPYGAAEVSATDLRGWPEVSTNSSGWNVGMIARRAGLLPQLGTVIASIEVALRTGRPATIWARVADEGALYLDAALSLVPPELLWDASFEIRSTAVVDQVPTAGPLIRVGVADPDAVAGPEVLVLGKLGHVRAAAVVCPECQLPEETWASLITAAISDLENAALASGDRSACAQGAVVLADAIAAMEMPQQGEPLADRVWDLLQRTAGPWVESGSATNGLWARLPRRRHRGLPGYAERATITSPRVTSAAAFNSYLSQPPRLVAGSAIEGALAHLAETGPVQETAQLAAILVKWRATPDLALPARLLWPDDWWRIISLHMGLGWPQTAAAHRIRVFIGTVLRPTGSGGLDIAISAGPLMSGATSIFLNSVLIATLERAAIPGLGGIPTPVWDQLISTDPLYPDWPTPLFHPELASLFLNQWAPRVGAGRPQSSDLPGDVMLTACGPQNKLIGQLLVERAAKSARREQQAALAGALSDVWESFAGRPAALGLIDELINVVDPPPVDGYSSAPFGPDPRGRSLYGPFGSVSQGRDDRGANPWNSTQTPYQPSQPAGSHAMPESGVATSAAGDPDFPPDSRTRAPGAARLVGQDPPRFDDQSREN